MTTQADEKKELIAQLQDFIPKYEAYVDSQEQYLHIANEWKPDHQYPVEKEISILNGKMRELNGQIKSLDREIATCRKASTELQAQAQSFTSYARTIEATLAAPVNVQDVNAIKRKLLLKIIPLAIIFIFFFLLCLAIKTTAGELEVGIGSVVGLSAVAGALAGGVSLLLKRVIKNVDGKTFLIVWFAINVVVLLLLSSTVLGIPFALMGIVALGMGTIVLFSFPSLRQNPFIPIAIYALIFFVVWGTVAFYMSTSSPIGILVFLIVFLGLTAGAFMLFTRTDRRVLKEYSLRTTEEQNKYNQVLNGYLLSAQELASSPETSQFFTVPTDLPTFVVQLDGFSDYLLSAAQAIPGTIQSIETNKSQLHQANTKVSKRRAILLNTLKAEQQRDHATALDEAALKVSSAHSACEESSPIPLEKDWRLCEILLVDMLKGGRASTLEDALNRADTKEFRDEERAKRAEEWEELEREREEKARRWEEQRQHNEDMYNLAMKELEEAREQTLQLQKLLESNQGMAATMERTAFATERTAEGVEHIQDTLYDTNNTLNAMEASLKNIDKSTKSIKKWTKLGAVANIGTFANTTQMKGDLRQIKSHTAGIEKKAGAIYEQQKADSARDEKYQNDVRDRFNMW